jgi:uncharacterized protein YbjQ (UPF0145 family)
MTDFCRCGIPLANEDKCERCNEVIEPSRLRLIKTDGPNAISSDFDKRIQGIKVFTVDNPKTYTVVEEIGIIQGSSSKLAFWGLSKQSKRLSSAYEIAILNLKVEAAELGANGIVGVRLALNNSTGSAASIAGSSEAVMLIGTAVKIEKRP